MLERIRGRPGDRGEAAYHPIWGMRPLTRAGLIV